MGRVAEKKLPSPWTLAKLILLPKQGRDSALPESYRPISLLNTDYKILTKILATRLSKIQDKYIHSDQTGFINRQQIRDNVRHIRNIIHHVQETKTSALLDFCDAEEAFN